MSMDSGGKFENTGSVRDVNKKLVFLFKAPKDEGEDKFVKILSDAGFIVVSLPVLSFNFINTDLLSQYLENLQKYSALILTSTRGVEAVSFALNNCSKLCDISHISCYVVGKTTGEAASKLGLKCKGEDSGNAEELLKIIVADLKGTSQPVLYPCANIRRDTISTTLQQHGIQYEEIIVYETVKNQNIDQLVEEAVQKQGCPEYIVYFSPSGVKYTQSVFQNKLLYTHQSKFIAIGPTTEKELKSQGFTIFGVAEKPEPEALLEILHETLF
ncbi:hypothetical protein LOTGIDRAFT_231769 [Lottia gigantea]|uniref:Uroporphyrinogen-III synthase n=1 Tax=Lottia gigantea TaxID=225164 RepID=V4C5Y1_LOTGI|nr:hypothetical protein LOTGIDRAFT_231769 [Lottia gigantea]ESO97024.1 hypothetical protein LOTGIDRAFT_231769 [Lottia gigantea]